MTCSWCLTEIAAGDGELRDGKTGSYATHGDCFDEAVDSLRRPGVLCAAVHERGKPCQHHPGTQEII